MTVGGASRCVSAADRSIRAAPSMVSKPDEMSEALRVVAVSVDKFCTRLYKIYTSGEKGNAVCSPLSVDVLLAMLSYGAAGTTQKKLHATLGIASNEDAFKTGYGHLIDSLNMVKDVDLCVANKLFPATKFEIAPEYLRLCETTFRSALQSVSFADANAAAKTINCWCEEQTKKRVKGIVEAGDLGEDTALVLANAVYFKGQWKSKFDPLLTGDMPFYTDKTTFKNVATMKKTGKFNTGFIDELMASFIEIPYVGDELSMVIILPVEFGGLAHVKENIDKINVTEVLKTGRHMRVELHLPKFKIESTIDLQSTLEKMGLGEIFVGADFSNMTDSPVSVSKAIQKAFIVVNEEGCEAAAATVKTVHDKDGVGLALPVFAGVVEEPKFDD